MANYTNHKNNKPISKDLINEINKRLERGDTKTKIAKDLGIGHSTVRKYTKPFDWIISEEVRAEALQRLKSGQSRRSIAAELGISRKWVSELAPEKGNRAAPIPENIKMELVERAERGEPIARVSRELGINSESGYAIVYSHLDIPDKETIKLVMEQAASGKSYMEIAKEHGLSVAIARSIVVGGRSKKTYTEKEKMRLAELYSSGVGIGVIQKEFGCTGGTIKRAYEKAVQLNKVQPKITLSMEDDYELTRLQRNYPELFEWTNYARQWLKQIEGNYAVCCTAVHRFIKYIDKNSLFQKPSDFFNVKNVRKVPSFFELECTKSDHGAALNNEVVNLLDWILIQDEFLDVDIEGYVQTKKGFINPLQKEVRSLHIAHRDVESKKKVMPYWMILDLRRKICQGPNFKDWTWLQSISGKAMLYGDKESRDWYEVDEKFLDNNDPDCVTRTRRFANGRIITEMWSPVRWVVCLIKLQTIGRLGQIRMLDSGEADTFIYRNGELEFNSSSLVMGTEKKPRQQGAIRMKENGYLCLFFNTNKTADIRKIGPQKGMECPWPRFPEIEDNPYYWLEKIRNWQEKYNPIVSATPWSEIPSVRRLRGKSKKVCSSYPDATFLFRTPESKKDKHLPVTNGVIDKAWQRIMSGYQDSLIKENKKNPDGSLVQIIKNGRAEISPHAIRVSLITHFITDGGVPPEIMMKIVGHSRFVMTVYYTKPGLKRIEKEIENAARLLDSKKDEYLIRDLSTFSAEMIRERIVFNTTSISDVLQLNPADRNPVGWLPLHDGICLAGGNTGPVNGDYRYPGCHNGGALIDASKNHYGPVPGGVRNCCRCRWKCVGREHALGLQATFNNRQYHLYKEGEKAIDAEKKRNDLLRLKATCENENVTFDKYKELRQSERLYEASMQRMHDLALDISAIHKSVERLKELPFNSEGNKSLISQGDVMSLNSIVENTDSQLLVLAGICADVEFFPDLDPGTAIFELSNLLDIAFEREGMPPIFSRMSEDEKLSCANAFINELEIAANPDNKYLGRKLAIEALERQECIEKSLGIEIKRILKKLPYKDAENTSVIMKLPSRG